jgi:hypothetical protein
MMRLMRGAPGEGSERTMCRLAHLRHARGTMRPKRVTTRLLWSIREVEQLDRRDNHLRFLLRDVVLGTFGDNQLPLR